MKTIILAISLAGALLLLLLMTDMSTRGSKKVSEEFASPRKPLGKLATDADHVNIAPRRPLAVLDKASQLDSSGSEPANEEIYSEEYRILELKREMNELDERLGTDPSDSPKAETARNLLNEVLEALPSDQREAVLIDSFECYGKGCVAKLAFADELGFMRNQDAFVTGGSAMKWEGPRVLGGPMPMDGGQVVSNWYLFF